MSAESNEPKYPVLDDIDVPEKVIEKARWLYRY